MMRFGINNKTRMKGHMIMQIRLYISFNNKDPPSLIITTEINSIKPKAKPIKR